MQCVICTTTSFPKVSGQIFLHCYVCLGESASLEAGPINLICTKKTVSTHLEDTIRLSRLLSRDGWAIRRLGLISCLASFPFCLSSGFASKLEYQDGPSDPQFGHSRIVLEACQPCCIGSSLYICTALYGQGRKSLRILESQVQVPGFETSRCQCSDAGATSLDPAEKLKAELIKQVTEAWWSMQRDVNQKTQEAV